MIILFYIWLFLTCIVGLFIIGGYIVRRLPEGHRLRVWWNNHIVTELGPEDNRLDR